MRIRGKNAPDNVAFLGLGFLDWFASSSIGMGLRGWLGQAGSDLYLEVL